MRTSKHVHLFCDVPIPYTDNVKNYFIIGTEPEWSSHGIIYIVIQYTKRKAT